MSFFNFFGGPSNDDLDEYIANDAVIIDVRTPPEFAAGHVQGSENIPLDVIAYKVDEIKALDKPVITCCRSGARSGSAAAMLKQHGIDAVNGGPWQNVAAALQK